MLMVEKETQTFMDVVMPVVEYEDEKRATSVQVQRPQNLKDKTIALLPNFRTVSPAFLQLLAKQLQTDTEVGRAFMHNPPDWPFNHPEHLSRIAPEVVKFARQCDLMVSGVGD